ncbi:MAG: DUF6588 family protein [Bacteroidales bacterium]|jgi:hypothetical protein
MNRVTKRRISVLIAGILIVSSSVFSQFSDVDFLRSSPADAVKFMQAYVTPWANAFGAGLNGSWYNTAKPHKLGGFDVTFSANVGIVPSSAKTFDISSIGLSSDLSGTGNAPTVAGPKTDGPQMTYSKEGYTLANFTTPPGTNWRFIPVPTLQAGIGLPLGTEIKIRYVPKIDIKDGHVSLWGVGLMHSITQYMPGHKLLPFDISLFAGYTKLSADVPLSLQPDPEIFLNYSTIDPSTYFNDQNMNATVQALNISAIGSINLKVITFYAGLGYSRTSTSVNLEGHYPVPTLVDGEAEYNDTSIETGSDFPKIDIKNYSGLRTNIGFRIKLAIITIQADYTRAQYNVVSTGLGFSFR